MKALSALRRLAAGHVQAPRRALATHSSSSARGAEVRRERERERGEESEQERNRRAGNGAARVAKSPAAHLSFSSPLPLPATQPAPAPHLLVFGGNGFVGSRVCERALASGLGVVSVSRSGAPPTRAGGGGVHGPSAAAAQHRLPGVDHQVEQNLQQLLVKRHKKMAHKVLPSRLCKKLALTVVWLRHRR